MIKGIPYFGSDNNEIYEEILNCDTKNIEQTSISIYELSNISLKCNYIVIIDGKWLSWLHDITFNYRDKKCYIPYYTYETYRTEKNTYKSDNKGHLILNDGSIDIRYEFCLSEISIDIGTELVLYNIETHKNMQAVLDKWIDTDKYSIEMLYNLYIDSCYKEDDFIYLKHLGGYHTINVNIKAYSNREKKLREEYNLSTYSNLSKAYEKSYRDVRNYKYEEVIQLVGMRDTIENYNIRKLRFESYLYCNLRNNSISDDKQFNELFSQLGKTKDIIKYGDNIKLIFKSYWLDEYRPIVKKSWSRV